MALERRADCYWGRSMRAVEVLEDVTTSALDCQSLFSLHGSLLTEPASSRESWFQPS
jgi:hypothetical protein